MLPRPKTWAICINFATSNDSTGYWRPKSRKGNGRVFLDRKLQHLALPKLRGVGVSKSETVICIIGSKAIEFQIDGFERQ